MKISELQTGQGNVELTVEVVSMEETREFEKYGRKLRVANALVKDDTGEIKMTLWNDDIEKVKQGMTLHIKQGYCSEFKGEKQVTKGKLGGFEVLGSGEGTEAVEEVENAEAVEEVENAETAGEEKPAASEEEGLL